ncbi:MAG TPA: hypothetical protein VN420_02845 [Candidatus Fimivivens sp.]|nr:hypothetical protein [Candidatus Fimivivens sp.]
MPNETASHALKALLSDAIIPNEPGLNLRIAAIGYDGDRTIIIAGGERNGKLVFTFPTEQYPDLSPDMVYNKHGMRLVTSDIDGRVVSQITYECQDTPPSPFLDARLYTDIGKAIPLETNVPIPLYAIEFYLASGTAAVWFKHGDGYLRHQLEPEIVGTMGSDLILASYHPGKRSFFIIKPENSPYCVPKILKR